jgi:hypothetical protein
MIGICWVMRSRPRTLESLKSGSSRVVQMDRNETRSDELHDWTVPYENYRTKDVGDGWAVVAVDGWQWRLSNATGPLVLGLHLEAPRIDTRDPITTFIMLLLVMAGNAVFLDRCDLCCPDPGRVKKEKTGFCEYR